MKTVRETVDLGPAEPPVEPEPYSPPSPPKAKVKKPPVKKEPQPPREIENKDDPSIQLYLQAAAEADDQQAVQLQPCSICGRKFAVDRLERHAKVCKKSSQKKRKVFDPVKMRTEGTEQAKYVNESVRRPEPKKQPKVN